MDHTDNLNPCQPGNIKAHEWKKITLKTGWLTQKENTKDHHPTNSDNPVSKPPEDNTLELNNAVTNGGRRNTMAAEQPQHLAQNINVRDIKGTCQTEFIYYFFINIYF